MRGRNIFEGQVGGIFLLALPFLLWYETLFVGGVLEFQEHL